LQSRTEVWSDPKLGTRVVVSIDRVPIQTFVSSQSQAGADSAWWRPYLTGYRAKLRSGDFHVVGPGSIAGQPVTWIASTPLFEQSKQRALVTEIALSRATHKPLYLRERIDGAIRKGSGVRVLSVETLPRQPSLFAHPTRSYGPGLELFYTPGRSGIPTTILEARAAMRPDPITPPARIDGLRRTFVGQPDYISPYNSYKDQPNGLQLYYGRLDSYRSPTYSGDFLSITEFPRANIVVTFNGIGLFPKRAAIITIREDVIATLHAHGLYLIIQTNSRRHTIAAVRALTHE
jgi:hypothetical protein